MSRRFILFMEALSADLVLSGRHMRTASNTKAIGSCPSRCQSWRSIWIPVVNSTGIDSTSHEGDDGVIASVYRAENNTLYLLCCRGLYNNVLF
ncbi:hypothetical protein IWW34DRAFT_738048 [Fusarium oxysporum f. sp. albedinis]|nr:hypothetical protein IWW34DRAFT_738048 [Fusarium oxysporum f. sp. albedinis]